MASNIPGATNVLPGVFTNVQTQSAGGAVAGGLRVASIIGEGITNETIISSALGGGKDGLNSSYSSASGADGRHFLLGIYPVVSNRTILYRNGTPLVGLEQTITGTTFSSKYDYRLDITTGRIELQKGSLQDLGGSLYLPFTTNKGDGYVAYLDLDGYGLVDENAPRETWSVRCISVQRGNDGLPIANTAKFIAIGSVSGNKVDANGNPVIWTSNGIAASNGILRFAIFQSVSGTAFQEGDGFTIKVISGQLVKGDSLTAYYIPTSYLNDPVYLQGAADVYARHGSGTVNNTLGLGSQLAFANSAPGVMAVQAAPPMPRRTSVILSEAVPSNTVPIVDDNFVLPLPLGLVPDPGADATGAPIHFFVKDNATGVETQVLPNKVDFYSLTSGEISGFISSTTEYPNGTSFSYSVVENYNSDATILAAFDGYVARDLSVGSGAAGIFSSPTMTFTADYKYKTIKIIGAANAANNLDGYVNSVANGMLYFSATFQNFATETGISYQIVDATTGVAVASGTTAEFTVAGTTTTVVDTGATFDPSYVGKRFKVTATTNQEVNLGLFDIVSYTSSTQIEIKKCVVVEDGLHYEILDPDQTSAYVVINKKVVPDGYALRVSVIDTKDAAFYDAGWTFALESLEKAEVDIVVPLPKQTISVIFQNAMSHCKAMSTTRNKKERVLFIGAIAGLNPENLIGSAADGTNTPVAVEDIGVLEGIQGDSPTEVLSGNIEDLANYSVIDAFGSTYRCVYFCPDQIVVQAAGSNTLVDGFYIAAAVAGGVSAEPRVEMPITNKVYSGFSILRNKLYTTSTLESLASSGVTVLQPVSGGGRVVWGITTTQSGFAEEQEVSIVFIRDRIAKTMRKSFAGYIGLPESADTAADMSTQAVKVLNAFVSQNLITGYKDVTVKKDSTEARQWNISCKVAATNPINWIYINVGVGTL